MSDRLFDPPDDPTSCEHCWIDDLAKAAVEGVTNFVHDNLGGIEYNAKELEALFKEALQEHTSGWSPCKGSIMEEQGDNIYERERDRQLMGDYE